jgi:S-DNA-T family DNA segregation ATPase FtsK/SpoIIIE
MQSVLKDGPSVGVFVMAICGGTDTFSRWVQHDFELKVLGQLKANDSSLLIDSPSVSDLQKWLIKVSEKWRRTQCDIQ